MPDKIQQEIEELLAKLDTFPPPKSRWTKFKESVRGFFRGIGGAFSNSRLPNVNAGHLFLASVVIIVISWVALSGTLVTWFLAAGILLFILAFVLSLRRQSRRGTPEKLWRGKPMDLHGPDDRGGPFWDRWRTRR